MSVTFIVLGFVLVFLVVSFLQERIYVYDDGIKIKDLMYPLWIQNDTIVSIKMIDNLPSLIYRTNGGGLGRIQKGYYTIKKDGEHSENATLYIRNRKASAIEIRTVKGLIYINRKNDEQTQELFDEIKNNVKILKENELNYEAKRPRTYRSVFIIVVFIAALIAYPIFFANYGNEIIVVDNKIEIKGDYSMYIPFDDIDTVLLVESLPEIKLRTNGISTRKVNIGNFKMADGNKCRLYINKSIPLYVEIRLDAQDSPSESLVFINRKTVDETKLLYDQIIDNLQ
ncbi:MAG: hypothetical protein E7067_08480 [Lentimicrobiaceae bacterium]|nr:hypothetical protein [Lentimicrobiaceae bacterium]